MSVPPIRVVDLETTGSRPPAHGVCEIGWQDLELDAEGVWRIAKGRGAFLIDPGRDIPAITQAVHHIVDADVAGAPRWQDTAPDVLRRPGGFTALVAHRAAFEQQFCTPELTQGAAWICTWKCALRLWPDSPGFSNQVLRYWRQPVGLDRELGLPVHRAFPDAYVTAHHVRDMLAEASVEQLIEWSALPGLLPRVRQGEDRGTAFEELPTARLEELSRDRDGDVRYTARLHLERRGAGALPAPAVSRQTELF
ncbi:3'-5' exonuclease [Pacificimonas flava]|uniref:Exodeoxyribonuclease X n=1 Tax=Pacificimonas flava TaxID=1234595 RepID=M2U2E5_9SPHN|nr:3'-5' exonuclease [Pacificimonas flava]EMD82152.1 Exodeoxyribonuclease X [Pacificimonas flava]MBB5280368.1 exodeoxyribonuclease X [Pacificimonas flava]